MANRAKDVSQLTGPGGGSCRPVLSSTANRRRPTQDRADRLSVATASIAHEVIQPLCCIMAHASTCLSMLNVEPFNVQEARDSMLRILRDVNRASDIIDRLRALFVKSTPASEPVDLNELLYETVALAERELSNARVTVNYELERRPLINGDRVQLQQVLLNLVRNACDAMSAVNDRGRALTIATEPDGNDNVRISVRDVGVGFDATQSDALFAPFYTTKSNGMGIGLAVSRSIVEKHHGRLWATPNPDGPGATFSFTLPGGSPISRQS